MQYLGDCRVEQQFAQGLQIGDGQRVNKVATPTVTNLNQAGNGVEGITAHKLRVYRDRRLLAPMLAKPGKLCILVNPDRIRGYSHNILSFKNSALSKTPCDWKKRAPECRHPHTPAPRRGVPRERCAIPSRPFCAPAL